MSEPARPNTIPVDILKFKGAQDVPNHSMPTALKSKAGLCLEYAPALRHFVLSGSLLGKEYEGKCVLIHEGHASYWCSPSVSPTKK